MRVVLAATGNTEQPGDATKIERDEVPRPFGPKSGVRVSWRAVSEEVSEFCPLDEGGGRVFAVIGDLTGQCPGACDETLGFERDQLRIEGLSFLFEPGPDSRAPQHREPSVHRDERWSGHTQRDLLGRPACDAILEGRCHHVRQRANVAAEEGRKAGERPASAGAPIPSDRDWGQSRSIAQAHVRPAVESPVCRWPPAARAANSRGSYGNFLSILLDLWRLVSYGWLGRWMVLNNPLSSTQPKRARPWSSSLHF